MSPDFLMRRSRKIFRIPTMINPIARPTGELVHDDLLVSAALCGVLDGEIWGTAQSEVIPPRTCWMILILTRIFMGYACKTTA